MSTMLSIRNFSLGFAEGSNLLRAINLEVPENSRVGLVGASGSGKTLLAWSMLGLVPENAYTEGAIDFRTIQGTKVDLLTSDSAHDIRGRNVAIIPQNPFTSLNPAFRCGHQIKEAIRGKHSRGDVKSRILERLAVFGIEDPDRIFGSYPHELSGGQLQRVVVAMATINDPDLLVADEPTTALDTVVQRDVLQRIVEWQNANNRSSLVMISHDPEVIGLTCERIFELGHGRVESEFSVDEFRKQRSPGAEVPRGKYLESPSFAVKPSTEKIHVDGIAKTFTSRGKGARRTEALAGIDLRIEKGEILGLVGVSGSGKSTLARIISGLTAADSGHVFIGGREHLRRTRMERSAMVQMIFQDPYSSLYPHKTVGYIIREALTLHNPELANEEVARRVSELLTDVGLEEEIADRMTRNLSGGERQRVQIARALAAEPEILLCDECVAGLDRPVQQRILGLLTELNERKGVTVMFVSHDLEVIRQICHRIAVINDGRIVESGDTQQIFNRPEHPRTKALLEARLDVIN